MKQGHLLRLLCAVQMKFYAAWSRPAVPADGAVFGWACPRAQALDYFRISLRETRRFAVSHPFVRERRMDGARDVVARISERGWVLGFPPIRPRTTNGWGTGIRTWVRSRSR